jgi:hypothetical protein
MAKTKGKEAGERDCILGDVTLNEVRLYHELIDKRRLERDGGGNFDVSFSFNGVEAIKHSFDEPRRFQKDREKLLWEYCVGKDLEARGANVPKIRGVYFGEGRPLLFMEKIADLTEIRELSSRDRKEAIKQFFQQKRRIKEAGYEIRDGNLDTNYGFSPKKREGYHHDFSDWRLILN